MLRSAEVMHLVARRATDFGVEIECSVRFRLDQAVARKDKIVRGITTSIHRNLDRRAEAIDFIRGEARFLSDHEIDTGDRVISFGKAIIATGARRATLPIEGLDSIEYLNNRSALELDRLPESLVIIGGGYVGIEFAQMYARFGSRVTLLGRNDHLAPGEDPELGDLLAECMREEGIEILTGTTVSAVREDGSDKIVTAVVDGSEREFRTEAILVAGGRVGNTDHLDLGAAGIEQRDKCFVAVDEKLRTNQPHVWAIGDVKGGWMFTHVATYDGPIAALNAVKDAGRHTDYRVVPRAVFSDPTLAAVGFTETEAREAGHDVLVGSVPVGGARARAIGESCGRIKAVVAKDGGEILGFHILAPHADDLLHEAVVAMYGHGTIDRISKSIHIHPTLSEMVKAAAKAAH